MTQSTDDRAAFLTPPEAAAILRVHLNTIYTLINAGDIPSIRVGKSHRIPRSEFEAKFGITVDRGAA
jgi:excisionase family DNA binding protein